MLDSMYQNVDDKPDHDEPVDPVLRAQQIRNRAIVTLIAMLAIIALIFVSLLPTTTHELAPSRAATDAAAQKLYATAIREPKAALRRARLIDFVETYPDHPRAAAARAQLQVLNNREATDWAELSEYIYNIYTKRAEKMEALERYETMWGPDYLGGRAEEMALIRYQLGLDSAPPKLAGNPEDMPDLGGHDFTPPPDEFPQSIQSNEMMGAQMPVVAPVLTPTPLPPPAPKLPDIIIEAARIKDAAQPTYPKSALRHSVTARVTLHLDIDEKGRVKDVRTGSVEAERYKKQFEQAAIRAARRSRFYPQTQNGRAVPAQGISKTYVFQVDE